MRPLFAVDSDDKVTQALWDQVVSVSIEGPKIWFRYLDTLTVDEIVLLHSMGCALGAIYRGATAASVAGGYTQGVIDAKTANTMATQIGLPTSMCLFLDVEAGWTPTVSYLEGWADTMRAGPFWKAGGIYCAPFAANFYRPFLAARAQNENVAAIVLWSAQPVLDASTALSMPEWGPATDGSAAVVAWQYYEGRSGDMYGGVVDLDQVHPDFQGVWVAPVAQPSVSPTPAASVPPPPSSGTPPAAVSYQTPGGLVEQFSVTGGIDRQTYKFTFPATFAGPDGSRALNITLDTGAFELLLAGPDVVGLNLPNQGALQVQGVTGSSPAYYSQVDVTIAGQSFHGVNCVVDPESAAGGSLFGLRWFIDRQLGLLLDTVAQELLVFGPPV